MNSKTFNIVSSAFTCLAMWLLLAIWAIEGTGFAANVFLFIAWWCSVLSITAMCIEPDELPPPVPAWLSHILRLSWGVFIVLMAGDGRFVLASVMLVSLFASAEIRRQAIEQEQRRVESNDR